MLRTSRFLLSLLLLCSILFSPFTASAQEEASSGAKPTVLSQVNEAIFSVLFFDVAFGAIQIDEVTFDGTLVLNDDGSPKKQTVPVPFLVTILSLGAIFFTFYHGFINIRGFRHALNIVRGKYDKEEDAGEISHFRALTSALSATVGLGNIAGVAVAIQTGGPGAVFWMMLLALFGMTAKFNSCSLAQMYRQVNEDGSISGGPMYYIDLGLKNKGPIIAIIGKILSVMFAIMVMGGALGGGNMFQANQTVEAFTGTFDLGSNAGHAIGIIMACAVAVVILGGIKRIGAATSKIVPAMCGLYVFACLIIILTNLGNIPSAIGLIFSMAFTANAAFGGTVGVIVRGITRAAFSNEAGLGSAAIAHAAAKTDEPIREGMVAMLGPLIDTIIICFMTSMVIIVTGTWANPELAAQGGNIGVTLTTESFRTVLPWFPTVLTICIGLFAYSTMISWCYYGERGWIYLLDHFGKGFGHKTLSLYRIVFVFFVYLGAVSKLQDVLDFSDAMILSIAFPNIIGSLFLVKEVRNRLDDYLNRFKND
ncbi:MAG: alanine:cation symporter family protein [Bdellovibrionales bacterium]|nr:alanine:cation symporter family protein [Bdellovibrionales bacterium]